MTKYITKAVPLLRRGLCRFNIHDFEDNRDHPYSKFGYYVYECKHCHYAVVSQPGYDWHPVKNAKEARKELGIDLDD